VLPESFIEGLPVCSNYNSTKRAAKIVMDNWMDEEQLCPEPCSILKVKKIGFFKNTTLTKFILL